jgi:hypothetical protein
MKQASLLFAFCMLFTLSAVSQTTTTVDNSTKRITITTKKVDDNGKTITETYIAEGEDPSRMLEEMAINPEVIQTVNIEGDLNTENGERLFLIRSAGDNVVIEGKLDENVELMENQEVIIIRKTDDATGVQETKKISTWHGEAKKPRAYAYVNVGERKVNCAALGVYADAHGDMFGAHINKLIDKGAAQEAGLLEGDIIKNIDEFDVSDYSTLFFALSHYRPGDNVTIKYERDGKFLNAKATLKDWAAMPGFEDKARSDCGPSEVPAEKELDQAITDDPSFVPNIQPLELEDARIYPNPTDGEFAFSFSTKQKGALTVSITDANGKVVFRDINDNDTGYYNRDIDIRDFPQGNYIISVSQGDKVFTQQISKQ